MGALFFGRSFSRATGAGAGGGPGAQGLHAAADPDAAPGLQHTHRGALPRGAGRRHRGDQHLLVPGGGHERQRRRGDTGAGVPALGHPAAARGSPAPAGGVDPRRLGRLRGAPARRPGAGLHAGRRRGRSPPRRPGRGPRLGGADGPRGPRRIIPLRQRPGQGGARRAQRRAGPGRPRGRARAGRDPARIRDAEGQGQHAGRGGQARLHLPVADPQAGQRPPGPAGPGGGIHAGPGGDPRCAGQGGLQDHGPGAGAPGEAPPPRRQKACFGGPDGDPRARRRDPGAGRQADPRALPPTSWRG